MTFYRAMYGQADEDAYIQHRIALASQSDVMNLTRINRAREAELTSSIIRYAQPRGVGMYQELTPVYGECTNPITQQTSFESDDGFQNHSGITQSYRPYSYGVAPDASVPPHVYASSSPNVFGSQGDLRQIGTPQHMAGMPPASGMPPAYTDQPHHDLPAILNQPDLQWITTSHTDMRTQSPINTSSPRPNMPRMYHPSSPTRPLHAQGSLEENTSSAATITHHQIAHHGFPQSNLQDPPPLQRVTKRPNTNTTTPPKPKGTPGRKRKFQDHELTPAEASKRHIRRERNKVAAAKCRNRRRELTDRLQGETDHLEDHQNLLHQEILSLTQEKEHLEFILAAHNPNCKAGINPGDSPIMTHDDARMMSGGMAEMTLVPPPEVMDEMMTSSQSDPNYYYMQQPRHHAAVISVPAPRHNDVQYDVSCADSSITGSNIPTDLSHRGQQYVPITNTNRMHNMTLETLDTMVDAPLETPTCTLTTPSHSNGIFTFPNTPSMTSGVTDVSFSFNTSTVNSDFNAPAPRMPTTPSYTASVTSFPAAALGNRGAIIQPMQSCSAAHRRSSSSESHQSPDSVKSPKLLAL